MSESKEWGFAVSVRGPYGNLDPDVLAAVERLLKRNHSVSQEHNADIPDLGENWLRVGPVTQAIDYDLCPVPRLSDRHPDYCQCGGAGVINPRVVDGVFEHAFAWYANNGEPMAGPTGYISANTPPVL